MSTSYPKAFKTARHSKVKTCNKLVTNLRPAFPILFCDANPPRNLKTNLKNVEALEILMSDVHRRISKNLRGLNFG